MGILAQFPRGERAFLFSPGTAGRTGHGDKLGWSQFPDFHHDIIMQACEFRTVFSRLPTWGSVATWFESASRDVYPFAQIRVRMSSAWLPSIRGIPARNRCR